ncbi:MAG: Zn-dependent alcohol dehydrogenase [Anaerolineae bacterium]|nr:Zn-dependent alcohol dehydrogenase [Phycisphaerae bacterium]
MKIRAAVLNEPKQPFVIEELDLDPPRAGEVLIKLAACGVCHSDWHVATGDTKHPFPVVTGHEGAGVVEAIGDGVDDVKIGDHVVLSWAPFCGRCFYCLRNKPNLCDTYTAPIWAGTMLDGTTRLSRTRDGKRELVYSYCGTASFATHTVVPRASCVVIRKEKEIKLDRVALIGCAVATGVGAALYTAQVKAGDIVVVFGCGGVGLSIVQGARLCAASQIIMVDAAPKKRFVPHHFGATGFLLATDDIVAAVKDHTDGRGADHVFEAIGVPRVQEQALECVRPGGTLTLAGLAPMGSATNFPSSIIARKEITIKGSYYGSVNAQRDFPMLVDLYASGKLDLDGMVTKRYSLGQINEAFAAMLRGELSRGVIVL